MPTIAELEARNEILVRRLEEVEQHLVQAEKRAEKAEVRAMQSETSAEKAAIEARLRVAALEAGSTELPTEGAQVGPLDSVVQGALLQGWKLDSQGKPYRPGPNGSLDYTTPAEWMAQFRKTAPRAFPNAQPAGTTGTTIPAGAANPWTAQHWNQTRQTEYQNQHGTDAADAMAKSAGSDLYATRPPAQ